MIKISIIIPVYNSAKYLPKMLDSLINQTLKDIEIICINDGSNDNSLAILKEYASKDKRIRVIDSDNKGQGAQRNMAIEYANGEYLGFVDSDDWVEPVMFETLYNNAKNFDADMSCCNFYIHKENKKSVQTYNFNLPVNTPFKYTENAIFDSHMAPWNRIIKTELVKKEKIFFGDGKMSEDKIFTIKSRILSKTSVYTDKCLYNYVVRNGSSLRSCNPDFAKTPALFKEIQYFLNGLRPLSTSLIRKFEEFAIFCLKGCYNRVPKELLTSFESDIKTYLGDDIYAAYNAQKVSKTPVIKRIFSVQNEYFWGDKYKVLNLFFLKFRLKKY